MGVSYAISNPKFTWCINKLWEINPGIGLLCATAACCWIVSAEAIHKDGNLVGQVGHAMGAIVGQLAVIVMAITRAC